MNEKPPQNTESVLLNALVADEDVALHPQDTVETAGDTMRRHDASTWPVAEDRKLVGVVGEKNPDWSVGGHGHDPKTEKVSTIMNPNAIFCYEDEDCASARHLMETRGLSYLPVVDRQMRIVGIFTSEEIKEKAAALPTLQPKILSD